MLVLLTSSVWVLAAGVGGPSIADASTREATGASSQHPAPSPTPGLSPSPRPSPSPTTSTSPSPSPSPSPSQSPDPRPSPEPSPEPEPTSEPEPSPSPAADRAPAPQLETERFEPADAAEDGADVEDAEGEVVEDGVVVERDAERQRLPDGEEEQQVPSTTRQPPAANDTVRPGALGRRAVVPDASLEVDEDGEEPSGSVASRVPTAALAAMGGLIGVAAIAGTTWTLRRRRASRGRT